ncbi:MAG: hypothetical protein M3548_00655 [Actinomycetota bacterium]|nr:hypothetical protein [Actinomycetota bacterium]
MTLTEDTELSAKIADVQKAGGEVTFIDLTGGGWDRVRGGPMIRLLCVLVGAVLAIMANTLESPWLYVGLILPACALLLPWNTLHRNEGPGSNPTRDHR